MLNNQAHAAVTPSQAVLQVMPATAPLNIASLYNANLGALRQFVGELKLKAYSENTIRTYRNEFIQVLQSLKNKNVNTLESADIRRYMVFAMEKQGIEENTAHSRLNAVKFYFGQVLKRENFFGR